MKISRSSFLIDPLYEIGVIFVPEFLFHSVICFVHSSVSLPNSIKFLLETPLSPRALTCAVAVCCTALERSIWAMLTSSYASLLANRASVKTGDTKGMVDKLLLEILQLFSSTDNSKTQRLSWSLLVHFFPTLFRWPVLL